MKVWQSIHISDAWQLRIESQTRKERYSEKGDKCESQFSTKQLEIVKRGIRYKAMLWSYMTILVDVALRVQGSSDREYLMVIHHVQRIDAVDAA